MEELARSRNTPGTDASFDLLKRVAVDPDVADRYPDRTAIIPADAPDVSVMIQRALEQKRPIAFVFADGSDLVARPPERRGVLVWTMAVGILNEFFARRRDAPTFVPRDWVTEFHAAPQRQPASV